jgi:prepilin-type processing-associated H-X9-DG protein
LYPDYVEDLRIFVCPSSSAQTADVEAPWFTDMTLVESHLSPILTADPRNVEVLPTITGERIDTECMTSQHYIYLPHAVATEENLLFLFDEYYRLMAIGATQFLWSDLEVPGGHGPGGQDTFFRIYDGVHRMFIENVDRPGLTAVPESEIPLLFDVMSILGTNLPNHVVPMGGNVLYMDGHVDFMKYPDDRLRPPYTEVLVEWLRANTYNNDVLKDVPPWCSNRLPGTEFAPRYLFYPSDPIYQDLYFTF